MCMVGEFMSVCVCACVHMCNQFCGGCLRENEITVIAGMLFVCVCIRMCALVIIMDEM